MRFLHWTIHQLTRFVRGTLFFFGRLARDVWLDVWRGTRPLVVKAIKYGALLLLALWLITSQPDLVAVVLQLAILAAGFLFIWRIVFPQKKKKRR